MLHVVFEDAPVADGARAVLLFEGGLLFGETRDVHDAADRRRVLVGCGPRGAFGPREAEAAGAALQRRLDGASATLEAGAPPDLLARVGFGARLQAYRYDRLKTLGPVVEPGLLTLPPEAEPHWAPLAALADGVALARDLANAPPNLMSPLLFAEQCRALEALGVEVEVLGLETLKALGMGALIGVGQGSHAPPCVVVLHWRGGEGAPLVLAGKGVTFDSGGLTPKPPEEMWDMKYDRAGAAAVTGAIHALAAARAPVHVVGVLGLAENMPGGGAQRPGDVVTTMSGLSVEVLHTDSEGRLVLADVLTYAIDRFRPRAVIDIATLTGGVTAVLGLEYAGLHATSDILADQLLAAGRTCGEKLWRLPLDDAFDRMIRSPVADLQNISKVRWAGSATAAQFLRRFTGDTPWAHIDMLGPAWVKTGPGGATGFGVRVLWEMARPIPFAPLIAAE